MTWAPIRPDGWPTPDQALLIRAATLDGAEAFDAWREWRGHNPIANADHASVALLPQVLCNLRGQPLDRADRAALTSVYRWSWAQNQYLLSRLAAALRTLEGAGVPTMVIKGVPLALSYYGDLGARAMADTDLLIRAEDLPRALSALSADGWRYADSVPAEALASLFQDVSLWDDRRKSVDLHWRFFPMPLAGLDDGCWERSLAYEVLGVPTRRPAREDLLLAVLLGSRRIEAQNRARWIADAAAIVRGGPPEVDWGAIVARAEAIGLALALRDTLGCARSVLPALIPADAEAAVTARPASSEALARYELFVELSLPLSESSLRGAFRAQWWAYAQWCRESGAAPGVPGFLRFVFLRNQARSGRRGAWNVLLRIAWKLGSRVIVGRSRQEARAPRASNAVEPAGAAPSPTATRSG